MESAPRTLLIVSGCSKERARYARALRRDPAYATTCFEAENGSVALALYGASRPNGVVVSTQLPDMDGWAFLAQLWREHGGVAAVLIGERADELRVKQALQPNSYEYLAQRDATRAATQRAVQQAIRQRALEQQVAEMNVELAGQRQELDVVLKRADHVLESLPDSCFLLNHQWRFVVVNRETEHLFARPRAALLDQCLWDVFPANTPHEVVEMHRTSFVNAVSGQEPVRFEVFLPSKPGWYEVRAVPSPEGLTVYVQDITYRRSMSAAVLGEREQAEHALRRRAREFSTLVDNLPDIIARFDSRRRHLLVSSAVERATGLPPSAFIGRTNQELGMPEHLCELWDRHLVSVFETGRESRFEWNMVIADGIRHYESTIVPEHNDQGVVETVLGISRDVSAQKRSEQSLRFLDEVSTKLGASLEYAATVRQVAHLAVPAIADQVAVHLREDDGSLKCIAEHAEPAPRVRGWLAPCIMPEDATNLGPASVLRSGQPELVRDTAVPVAADTERRSARLHQLGVHSVMTVPMKIGHRLVGTLSLAVTESNRRFDMADLHLAEELARRSAVAIDNARLYQTAHEAVRERDAFLSVAAHEIKNPLSTVLGHAQLMERRAKRSNEASERDRYDLSMIVEQTRRATTLLNDLQDVSLFESGLHTWTSEPIELRTLIHRIVASIGPSLTGFTLNMSPHPEPLMVPGDAARLEQVFHNLIGNAVKYSPNGGTITIDISTRDQVACISISDTGIGIPPSAIPDLFKRFFRVRTERTEHIPGSGLGLYVVKQIVSQHGGTITVVSTEGEGSTFSVELPLFVSATLPAASVIRDALHED